MYKLKIFTLIFALLSIFFIDNILSQNTWTRTFGVPFYNDEAHSTIQTLDGNFLVVGDTGFHSARFIIKYSQTGQMLWGKSYSNNEIIGLIAAEDQSGNLYFNTGTGIAKTDSEGNFLWRRNFPDTASAMFIKLTLDKQRLLCYGHNNLSLSDSSGNLLWYHNLDDSVFTSYHIKDVVEISSSFYFTGVRESSDGYSGFVWKYDIGGSLIWSKFYNQSELINSVVANSANSILVAGTKNYYLYIAKLDLGGTVIWERSYIQDSLSMAFSIKVAGSNKFVLATGGYESGSKCVVIDSSGNLVINKEHNYAQLDNVLYKHVIAANDSGFVFTGYIEFNNSGPVDWLVVKTDKFGNTTPIGIEPINSEIPEQFKLYQNYPNPFNPTTKIKFEVPLSRGVSEGRGVFISFEVFDITGREVFTLNESRPPGTYELTFDGSKLTSGIYFYSLLAGEFSQTQKMILLK